MQGGHLATTQRSIRVNQIREGLHKLYLPRFDKLVETLPEAWIPTSGYRNMDDQTALFMKGRDPSGLILDRGSVVTFANAGESPHNWGCASDWTLFQDGKPQWSHNRWNEYSTAVAASSLIWGGTFKSFQDKPHNEMPMNITWKELCQYRKDRGQKAALDLLEKSLII